jgi:hypothetical protein
MKEYHLIDGKVTEIVFADITELQQGQEACVKQLFFAKHIGFNIASNTFPKGGLGPVSEILHHGYKTYSANFFSWIDQKHYLLLRSLEQLSDEEKQMIADIMQFYPEDVIDWINGDCGHDDFDNLWTWLPCFDILRSIGILLPFTFIHNNKPVTLSVEDILKLGWAKIKIS